MKRFTTTFSICLFTAALFCMPAVSFAGGQCKISVEFTNNTGKKLKIAWVKYKFKGSTVAYVSSKKTRIEAGKKASVHSAKNNAGDCGVYRKRVQYKIKCVANGHKYKIHKTGFAKTKGSSVHQWFKITVATCPGK